MKSFIGHGARIACFLYLLKPSMTLLNFVSKAILNGSVILETQDFEYLHFLIGIC